MTEEGDFEGGCLCGDIRYRSSRPQVRGVICHCSECRKHTGSFLACVHFPIGAFTWLGPEPTRYRSSAEGERGFCPRCGSTLTFHEEGVTDRVKVTMGSLDEPERAHIDDHVWTREQVSWIDNKDDLPRFDTSSSSTSRQTGD